MSNGKLVLSFIVGAVSGGAGVYVYLTKIKKIEYEVIEPEESIYVEEENEDGETEWVQYNKTQNKLDPEVADASEVDLMDFYKQKESEETTTNIDYRQFVNSVERPDPARVPKERTYTFELSEEEYRDRELEAEMNGKPLSVSVVAVYGDGIVVDESDGKETMYTASDIEDYMGSKIIEDFIENEDKDEIYIWNAKYGIYYEVYKKEAGWAEMNSLDDEEPDDQE